MVPRISRHCRPLLALVFILAVALPASAHRQIREWRSLGSPQSVAVNTHDGSVWAAIGSFVHHVSSDGTRLSRVRFVPKPGVAGQPTCVAVNPTDGSCWAFGRNGQQEGTLAHYAADGRELWRQGGFGPPKPWVGGYSPNLGVYPGDGSCWLAYTSSDGAAHLRRLSATGQTLFARDDAAWTSMGPLAVNPSDGSCSVAVGRYLIRLSLDGTEVWRATAESTTEVTYSAVGVNSADGSVWLYDWPEVVHLAADGRELWRKRQVHGEAVPTYGISVNPTDGSAWLATPSPGLMHLSESGALLWFEDWYAASAVCVDPQDGSVWGARWNDPVRLVHLAADGTTRWEMKGDYYPEWVAANSADGSCWVADDTYVGGGAALSPGAARVSAAGATLWSGAPAPDRFTYACAVAVNAHGGSSWLIEEEHPGITPGTTTARLTHLSASGGELDRITLAEYPSSNSRSLTETVDSSDGSVWVSCFDPSAGTSQLQRYAAEGTLDWNASYPGDVLAMSAAGDGSCWLIDGTAHTAVRLARDGTTLAQYGRLGSLLGLAADPADCSCWVSSASTGGPPQYQVAHIAADGAELWRSSVVTGTDGARLSVDSKTGFCWGADDRDIFAYSCTGLELWRGSIHPWKLSADPHDGACWFSTCNNSADSERELVRLQVPLTPFGDISYWHWARDEINACAEADIVQGYPSGAHAIYRPDQDVTRDQMAVYLARAFAGGDGSVHVPTGVTEPTFPDVDADHWAYRYIEYCAQQDLVQGFDTGNYEPTLTVTRDQMAVYIARGLAGGEDNVPTGPADATFPDVPNTGFGDDGTEPFWAYDHIEYCHLEGVVQGYGDGNYHPEYVLTRDQMAVFIARAFQLPLEWTTEG